MLDFSLEILPSGTGNELMTGSRVVTWTSRLRIWVTQHTRITFIEFIVCVGVDIKIPL